MPLPALAGHACRALPGCPLQELSLRLVLLRFYRHATSWALPLPNAFPPQSFEQLRQFTIYGYDESDKTSKRCLGALQKAMPWLLIDA